MKTKVVSLIAAAVMLGLLGSQGFAAHMHTHIGINQDQISGNEDDGKLWFFSMPGTTGWPEWGEPLELTYQESGPLAGKWICEDLYCWHSAHPDHGNWQLGGTDPNEVPDWRIALERVSFDEGFGMVEYDTLAPVLENDGDQYVFDETKMIFMEDKYNENGELGAWGIHYHLLFVVDSANPGDTFEATFRALDTGTTGFLSSDEYTMTFIATAIPEPCTIGLGVVGLLGFVIRRRKNRG